MQKSYSSLYVSPCYIMDLVGINLFKLCWIISKSFSFSILKKNLAIITLIRLLILIQLENFLIVLWIAIILMYWMYYGICLGTFSPLFKKNVFVSHTHVWYVDCTTNCFPHFSHNYQGNTCMFLLTLHIILILPT